MKQYQELLMCALRDGSWRACRSGRSTLGTFGVQAKFDLQEGFPIVTTQRTSFESFAEEMLWFLRGGRNIRYLVRKGVSIWTDLAFQPYAAARLGAIEGEDSELRDVDGSWRVKNSGYIEERKAFEEKIREDDNFAREWGDLGMIYGASWRGTGPRGRVGKKGPDQIKSIYEMLKETPDSRRMKVSAWVPQWLGNVAFPACHTEWQVWTRTLSEKEQAAATPALKGNDTAPSWNNGDSERPGIFEEVRFQRKSKEKTRKPKRELSIRVSLRSSDLIRGAPLNIGGFALLAHLLAHSRNMSVGTLTCQFGDAHIYDDDIKQASRILRRTPLERPRLLIESKRRKRPWEYSFEDLRLEGYRHYRSARRKEDPQQQDAQRSNPQKQGAGSKKAHGGEKEKKLLRREKLHFGSGEPGDFFGGGGNE